MKHIAFLIFSLTICHLNYGQTADDKYQEGQNYAEAKNFTMAIISYSAAIIKNPYEWRYYQARSWAYFKTRSYDQALTDINSSLDLKPKHKNFQCLYLRARIFIEKGDYSNAIDDLTYLLDYFPSEFETKIGIIHLNRGEAYLYSGQKEKACADFQESRIRKMYDAQQFIDKFCK